MTKNEKAALKPGERVKFSIKFVQSIQLHDNTFVGKLVDTDGFIATVQWDHAKTPNRVLLKNLVLEKTVDLE